MITDYFYANNEDYKFTTDASIRNLSDENSTKNDEANQSPYPGLNSYSEQANNMTSFLRKTTSTGFELACKAYEKAGKVGITGIAKGAQTATENAFKLFSEQLGNQNDRTLALEAEIASLKKKNEQLRIQHSEAYEELQWIEEDAQAQQSKTEQEIRDIAKKAVARIDALLEMRDSSDEEESHEQDNKTKETVVHDMQLSDDTTQAQSKEQRRKERKEKLAPAFAKIAQKQKEESKDAQE